MLVVSFSDAVKSTRENPGAAIEDAKDRLKPEVWPNINSNFRVPAKSTILTIGSCFARNIEAALNNLGYNIPSLDYEIEGFALPNNSFLNKYTPPSIYQELQWAAEVFKSGGDVTLEACESLLLRTSSGACIDLHLPGFEALSEDFFLARRRKVYDIFKHAFTGECVTITLGLIEAWYDKEKGIYIQESPLISKEMYRMGAKGRFELHRLDYQKAYEFTKRAIDTVRALNPDCKILITTSPVMLNRTFTTDDVITANMLSKSTLRTVCGAIALEYDQLDYFPSYESVNLTRDWSVFEEDLVHINPKFVAKIVRRLCGGYFEYADSDAEALDEVRRAYEAGEHAKVLAAAANSPPSAGLAFLAHSAAFALGDMPTALHWADIARKLGSTLETEMAAGVVLLRLDRAADAKEVLSHAVQRYPASQELRYHLADAYRRTGDLDAAVEHIRYAAEEISPRRAGLHQFLGDILQMRGELEAARDAYQFSLVLDPENEWTKSQLERCIASLASNAA